jgi:formylglycine-generating enzyme required for sulfatase activity
MWSFLLIVLVLSVGVSGQEASSPESIGELLDQVVIKQEMVLIPAGDFLMGAEDDNDDNPRHPVHVDAFYLDRYEVTNAQFFRYCQETGVALPAFWGMGEFFSGLDFPNHPVVGVSWYQAKSFAEWAGNRLPSEAEWEYAARGGLIGKKFPNGDEINSETIRYWPSDGPVKVASFSGNGFDLFDMSGNVVEWVADLYDRDYYRQSPPDNPPGPEKAKFRVIRGGGWHSGPYCNRVAHRNALYPAWVDFAVGFRCARDVDEIGASAGQ